MKRILLVGSFRFYKEMLEMRERLNSVGIDCDVPQPSKYRDPKEPSRFLTNLPSKDVLMRDAYGAALRCFQKIDECDLVYVVNKGGYVGKSTLLDIGYAFARNKPIYASEPLDDLAVMSLMKGVVSLNQLIEMAKSV